MVSFLDTMWRGEDQGLAEGRMMDFWSSAVYGFSATGRGKLGLGEASLVSTPLTWRWVSESTRRTLVISIRRLKWCRKFAPSMGCLIFAMRETHLKVRQRPWLMSSHHTDVAQVAIKVFTVAADVWSKET